MTEYEAVGPSQPDWPDGGRTVFAESDRRADRIAAKILEAAQQARYWAEMTEKYAEEIARLSK